MIKLITGDSLVFCLAATKMAGDGSYCYKIEPVNFFTLTWLTFEPSRSIFCQGC